MPAEAQPWVAPRFCTSCGSPIEPKLITCGHLTIDARCWQAWLDEQPLHLTGREFQILYALAFQYPYVVPHRKMAFEIWGDDPDIQPNSNIRKYVQRIRKKIGAGAIVAVEGFGYRLNEVA